MCLAEAGLHAASSPTDTGRALLSELGYRPVHRGRDLPRHSELVSRGYGMLLRVAERRVARPRLQ
jgi:hypothetical protein